MYALMGIYAKVYARTKEWGGGGGAMNITHFAELDTGVHVYIMQKCLSTLLSHHF